MDGTLITAIFAPKPTRQETKADVTTRVARDIMDKEAAARDAKSERLRAARLEREAVLSSDETKPAKKKPASTPARKLNAKAKTPVGA